MGRTLFAFRVPQSHPGPSYELSEHSNLCVPCASSWSSRICTWRLLTLRMLFIPQRQLHNPKLACHFHESPLSSCSVYSRGNPSPNLHPSRTHKLDGRAGARGNAPLPNENADARLVSLPCGACAGSRWPCLCCADALSCWSALADSPQNNKRLAVKPPSYYLTGAARSGRTRPLAGLLYQGHHRQNAR